MQRVTQTTFDAMLEALREVLKINTVKAAPAPNAPFGKGNEQCLNFVLDLAKSMGFEVFNCDNFAGHADFGSGDEVFGILGHLDVVPVAPTGWVKPPFAAEICDGYLYGRGVLDDKGPMMACLFAAKQLMDEGFKPRKKIRLIFGCDEESGWGCMERYSSKVKLPDVGISPDGDFPVINVEKGVLHLAFDVGFLPPSLKNVAGGERANIVLDECRATIDGKADVSGDVQCSFANDVTTITARGKAAHGSTPQFGDNAAWKLFKALKTAYPADETVNFVADKLCADYNGKGWGIFLSDEQSGDLTANIGYLRTECGRLVVGIDIRYPVSFKKQDVLALIKQNSPKGAKITVTGSHDPLYVPADSPLVKTLLQVFEEVTGQKALPLAVGGATYARALPLGVAFGPVFQDDEKVIHETNERVSLEKLRLMTELYYTAIKTLCE